MQEEEEEEEEEEGIYIDTQDMDDVPSRRHTNLRLLFPSFIWLLCLFVLLPSECSDYTFFLCACFLCSDQVCLWFFPVCLICLLVPSSACSDFIYTCVLFNCSFVCYLFYFVLSFICYFFYLFCYLLLALFDLSSVVCFIWSVASACSTICSYSFICSFPSNVWLLTSTCLD